MSIQSLLRTPRNGFPAQIQSLLEKGHPNIFELTIQHKQAGINHHGFHAHFCSWLQEQVPKIHIEPTKQKQHNGWLANRFKWVDRFYYWLDKRLGASPNHQSATVVAIVRYTTEDGEPLSAIANLGGDTLFQMADSLAQLKREGMDLQCYFLYT